MRLDVLLTSRGLAASREYAKKMISDGEVFVNGKPCVKPGANVAEDAEIEVRGEDRRFVSRGGYKLERALDEFGIELGGRVCLDCGASTGGFTDCLLQRGARTVYAVDVGTGQLAESLRNDERVISIENTNARNMTREMFAEAPELVTIDVSFISLALVLPTIKHVAAPTVEIVCLIKPQFEAGRGNVGKRGVVRDAAVHKSVLEGFVSTANELGFAVAGITPSPIIGPEGNIEFLGYLNTREGAAIDLDGVVRAAHIIPNVLNKQE